MNKTTISKSYRVLTLLVLLVGTAPLRAETFIDDMGRTLDIAAPVQRIVVFNRYNVEFVRALGAAERIVGTDALTVADRAYWPEFSQTNIAGQGQNELNYEVIVGLAPDMVILPRNGVWEQAAEQLEPFGISVLVMTAWDALKHDVNARLLGQLVGNEEQADALIAFHAEITALLAEKLRGAEPKRVYFEEVRDFVTVTPGSGWHDMIEAAGGINIFGDINLKHEPSARGNENSFVIDPEEIIARRPEVMIKLQRGSYETIPAAAFADALARLETRHDIAATPAGETNEVYLINYYLAGGCSKIIGALQIAAWLHPERFADTEAEEFMRRWTEEFQGLPFRGGMSWPRKEVKIISGESE